VKKMRSNKSKEFYAELKVLCKIHHINIVSNTSADIFFDLLLRAFMFEYNTGISKSQNCGPRLSLTIFFTFYHLIFINNCLNFMKTHESI